MMSQNLTNLLEEHIQKSTDFWAGKPKMTKKELDAVQKFAKEKEALFQKVLPTSEKS